MGKVKLEDILVETAGSALVEAIKTVKPKYKEKSGMELGAMLGLTEHQMNHLNDKALGEKLGEKVLSEIQNRLQSGDSIEIPNTCNLFVHQSSVRTNDNGKPAQKLSVRTREDMRKKLNQ